MRASRVQYFLIATMMSLSIMLLLTTYEMRRARTKARELELGLEQHIKDAEVFENRAALSATHLEFITPDHLKYLSEPRQRFKNLSKVQT